VLPQRPASCPPGHCSFFGEDTDDAPRCEDPAAGMDCASPRHSEWSEHCWEDVDAACKPNLWDSFAFSSVAASMLPDWQNGAGFMGGSQDWWPSTGSFVEYPLAGPDALTSIQPKGILPVENMNNFGNGLALPQSHPLGAPQIFGSAKASDYEPVKAFETEPVGDAPVVGSQVLQDVDGAGDDCKPMELDPRLGTEELPTIGSAGHWEGLCKPCAFVTKGCSSGAACTFCHLCGPEVKWRKRKFFQRGRQLRRAACGKGSDWK
jgi:hypothetical protein